MKFLVHDTIGAIEAIDTETWEIVKDIKIRPKNEVIAYLLSIDPTGCQGIAVQIEDTTIYVIGVSGGAFRLAEGKEYELKGYWAIYGEYEVVEENELS